MRAGSGSAAASHVDRPEQGTGARRLGTRGATAASVWHGGCVNVGRDTPVLDPGTFPGQHRQQLSGDDRRCGVYIGVGAVTLILLIVLLILLF